MDNIDEKIVQLEKDGVRHALRIGGKIGMFALKLGFKGSEKLLDAAFKLLAKSGKLLTDKLEGSKQTLKEIRFTTHRGAGGTSFRGSTWRSHRRIMCFLNAGAASLGSASQNL